MDIIPLASYLLDELAGIICFHARKLFGGYELPREVCIEVAARSRCNPRRAVRSLENDLLSEFYSKLPAAQRRQENSECAAAALMMRGVRRIRLPCRLLRFTAWNFVMR